MYTTLQIWDFDGTLVDSSHRYRTQYCEVKGERIDLEYWIENEHRTHQDRVIVKNAKIFDNGRYTRDTFQVIATARIWCKQSEQFIRDNNLEPDAVIARRDRNDDRGGAYLKIVGVNKLLEQMTNINKIEVFEDNIDYLKTICDYYQKKGYNVVGHYFPSKQGH